MTPPLYALMLAMPMSSPQMTRMFGFFPDDGAGDCAQTVETPVNAQSATARTNLGSLFSCRLIGLQANTKIASESFSHNEILCVNT